MSPYDSPAPYNLLQYTEIAEGIWYPRGGFHKVVEQLEKIATKKYDAKFIYNTGIEKIIVDDNKVAKGIRLENGEEKYADMVVCNAGKYIRLKHILFDCWTSFLGVIIHDYLFGDWSWLSFIPCKIDNLPIFPIDSRFGVRIQ